jgi:hypothetical protein
MVRQPRFPFEEEGSALASFSALRGLNPWLFPG